MNPDSYDPIETTFPEEEKEVTIGGHDFLVIATVVETREPVVNRETGKAGAEYSYSFACPPEVFPAVGDEYASDSLSGETLEAWVRDNEATVAKAIVEKLIDKSINDYEERLYGGPRTLPRKH